MDQSSEDSSSVVLPFLPVLPVLTVVTVSICFLFPFCVCLLFLTLLLVVHFFVVDALFKILDFSF